MKWQYPALYSFVEITKSGHNTSVMEALINPYMGTHNDSHAQHISGFADLLCPVVAQPRCQEVQELSQSALCSNHCWEIVSYTETV